MRRVLSLFSIAVSAVLLIGCASTLTSLKPGESIAEKEKYSYIYGSCKRPFVGFILSPHLDFYITLKNANGKSEDFKLSFPTKKSDEKDLFVFKLKPGKYTFYRMTLEGYTKTYDKEFELKEGTGNYLGYINFDRGILNVIGNSLSINITNDNDFDKKDLLSTYPDLSGLKFENLTVK